MSTPAVTHLDLQRHFPRFLGTVLHQGVESIEGDAAHRNLTVGNTDGTPISKSAAITKALSTLGSYHPEIKSLPLLDLQAHGRGVLQDVTAVYGRTRLSIPTVAAYTMATTSGGVWHAKYLQQPNQRAANGRPNGYIQFITNGRGNISFTPDLPAAGIGPLPRAVFYFWPVDTEKISVDVILSTNPFAAIQPYIGTVNGTALTLAEVFGASASGFQFPAYTLKCLAPIIRPYEQSCGTAAFQCRYEFEYAPDPGWVEQMFLTSGALGGTSSVVVSIEELSGAFGSIFVASYVTPPIEAFAGIASTYTPVACS